jgi:hypothetical protein
MATPPQYRVLEKDDVDGLKKPERLLFSLNQFLGDVAKALAAGLTTANTASYVRTIEVVGVDEGQDNPPVGGSPLAYIPPAFVAHSPPPFPKPIEFVLGEKGKPFPGEVQEIRVIRVVRKDGSLPGPVSVEGWQVGPIREDGRRTITLPRVNGLAPNVRYTLTLLIQAV